MNILLIDDFGKVLSILRAVISIADHATESHLLTYAWSSHGSRYSWSHLLKETERATRSWWSATSLRVRSILILWNVRTISTSNWPLRIYFRKIRRLLVFRKQPRTQLVDRDRIWFGNFTARLITMLTGYWILTRNRTLGHRKSVATSVRSRRFR